MSEVLEKPTRTKVAKTVVVKPMTLGQATDKLWQRRQDKALLEAQVKLIEIEIKGDGKEIVGLENEVIILLDAQGTRKAEGSKASVSINESVVGNVEDWSTFWTWIAKTKNFHLVQKRVSDPSIREIWAMNKVIPGVQPFTKRMLSVRSL